MSFRYLSRAATVIALSAAAPIASLPVSVLGSASVQAASPAETLVANFHAGLLSTMKQASSLGYSGRFKKLEPLIRRTFAIQAMAQIIVGPQQWKSLNAKDRAALVDAFGDWVVANYAGRFNDWDGESFVTTGTADGGRNTVIVQTEIRPQNVKLGYRVMGGKVVDVYLNGSISQLAQWRSEFSSVLGRQGVQGLIAQIKANERQLAR